MFPRAWVLGLVGLLLAPGALASVELVREDGDGERDVRMATLFGIRFVGERRCQDSAIDMVARSVALEGAVLAVRLALRDLDAGRIDCGAARLQEGPGFYLVQLLPGGCDPEFSRCPDGTVGVTAIFAPRSGDPTPSCVYVAFSTDGRASTCLAEHAVEGDALVWRLPLAGVATVDRFGQTSTRGYDLRGETYELSSFTSVQPMSRAFALIDEMPDASVSIPAVG